MKLLYIIINSYNIMSINLSNKNLTEIPDFSDSKILNSYGFDDPRKVYSLELWNNQISKIKNLDLLVNLKYLSLVEIK